MKIVHEWNCHLEVFSCPQVIENSRQYFCFSEPWDILHSRRVLLFTGLYHLKQGLWSYFAGGVVKNSSKSRCLRLHWASLVFRRQRVRPCTNCTGFSKYKLIHFAKRELDHSLLILLSEHLASFLLAISCLRTD